MLSLVTERQSTGVGPNSRVVQVVPQKEIIEPVKFLLSSQRDDGTFGDPHPMVHRYTMVISRFLKIYLLSMNHLLLPLLGK